MIEHRFRIAIAAAVALVLARSAVFLIWEQSAFDSDQAIFGLMAKHIAEGRSFPVFIYGDRYMLAMQAWLAAPLFALFSPSVALLKLPVVFVNVAAAALLIWILVRDAGLRPMIALLASLFFILAPPVVAKLLVETGGGNPEPFLYVLLLWVLRRRPVAFGLLLGLGFFHREFTVYGATAIVLISLLDDHRLTVARLQAAAIAATAFLLVSQLVTTAYAFSTPFGPGSTSGFAIDSTSAAGARYCWNPDSVAPSLMRLFTQYFGVPFGAVNEPMVDYGVRSYLAAGIPGVSSFWPMLGLLFAAALGRVAWIAVREKRAPWQGPGAVGLFLLLIALQSGMIYAVARCGRLEAATFRYALLTLYAGVGVAVLYLVYERNRVLRRVAVVVILAWAATSAASHTRLWHEYLTSAPGNPHRAIADYLVRNHVRYARADYWTAYAATFLAKEQVVIASTDTVRISSYQDQVGVHDKEAPVVQRQPCAGEGIRATDVYWVCAPGR
jgi:hypothetical protein